MDARLQNSINEVRSRMRRVRRLRIFAAGATVTALLLLVVWMLGPEISLVTLAIIVALASAASALIGVIAASVSFRDTRQIAARIEQANPDLRQRLLTALDQSPSDGGRLTYLQQRVIDSTAAHALRRGWSETVPSGRLLRAKTGAAVAFLLLIASALSIAYLRPASITADVLADSADTRGGIEVKPGDIEVERGNSVTVTARFRGDSVPAQVQLVQIDGSAEQRWGMTRSLDDPIFGGYLARVDADLQYRVESETLTSSTYMVRVFELPRMVRSDAKIVSPEYTGVPVKRIEDTVRVTAVEGAELTWSIHTNKPVSQASLIAEQGEPLVLEPSSQDPTQLTVTCELVKSQRWTLRLVDADGRENKFPPTLVARVLPNRPAELKLVAASDATVSPIEELRIAADAQDDFGVRRAGISLTLGTGAPQEIELLAAANVASVPAAAPETAAPVTQVEASEGAGQLRHTVDFEQLGAEPDQLLSYHFWAEDMGADGQMRRTTSDIFFAEVRPFEQIFREGNSPPGGGASPPSAEQQQQAQQAEQLGALQKQIVAAIWNLMRRADLAGAVGDQTLRAQFIEDVNTIAESQRSAREQLKSLTENLPPDRSPELVEAADAFMQETLNHLERAASEARQTPLPQSLVAARGAYDALLRLRAREFDVVQSNSQQQQQSGGGGAGRSQMQRQLDQLELKNDASRYETEQTAQEQPSSAAQQQARDVLSQLGDLARRQTDLNEQLQALELALQKAETEQQREEALRQLQRLREQQQEMLRDADELASQLRENAGSEAMESAAQQLEQTRENLRQAEQALENEQPSTARAAGSRAARSLEQMREAVKQETSTGLTEQVQQMQEQATELAEEQRRLQEAMRNMDQPEASAGLRAEENGRAEIAERFDQQRERSDELVEQMRETIREAEESQPLLANRLYEAQREAQRGQLSENLTTAGELLRRGYDPQARQAGDIAAEQIEKLNQEIESAARGILGDPTEALARAEGTLEQLAEQLAGERGQDPTEANAAKENATQAGQQPGGESSEGESQEGQAQEGQAQEGQSQEGQQQGGQSQGSQPGGGQSQSGQSQSGQSQSGQSQSGQSQDGQSQSGQSQDGQSQSGQSQDGQSQSGQTRRASGGGRSGGGGEGLLNGAWAEAFEGSEPGAMPITGDGYREWSDRLREVEDMLDDPELRSRATGIRDRARELRREVTRHAREPRWSEIEEMIASPLQELRMEVAAERLRRSAERTAVVPMDRDPVPERFSEAVRKYYEQLGAGR